MHAIRHRPFKRDGRVSFQIVGQCAYTYHVLRAILDRGLVPTGVWIEDDQADHDPFPCLTVNPLSPWWRRHIFYHRTWKRALALLCDSRRIPLVVQRDVLRDVSPSDILLAAGYSKKVPPSVIARYGLGALNAHPSLLPAFRGPQPEAQVILRGAAWSGVTIHLLTERFDSGPIYFQKSYAVPRLADVGHLECLEALLVAEGLQSIIEQWPPPAVALAAVENGQYYTWYRQEDVLDLSQCPDAESAARLLRLRPEGYAYCDVKGKRIFPLAWETRPSADALELAFGDGRLYCRRYVEQNWSWQIYFDMHWSL